MSVTAQSESLWSLSLVLVAVARALFQPSEVMLADDILRRDGLYQSQEGK